MITLEKALELFLMDQQLKGNTEKTIFNYERMITYFINFVGNKEINDIDIADVKSYQIYLSDKQAENYFSKDIKKTISKKTIQTYIKHIRVFFNWAYEETYIKENIGSKIKLPKAPKKVIEILSEDEIKTLYKSINDKTEFGLRNKTMISLMLDSGLRRDEVLLLGIYNVHFTQNVIKISGKGEKERIVPMGLYTKKLLFKYLNGYRPMPDYPTNNVFLSKDKTPVSRDSVKMLFARLKKKTGIQRLKPHLLRHTFATRYLMNGGDLFSLQMILGHSTLEMTRKYSHLASAYTVKNFKDLSTLDRIRGQNIRL